MKKMMMVFALLVAMVSVSWGTCSGYKTHPDVTVKEVAVIGNGTIEIFLEGYSESQKLIIPTGHTNKNSLLSLLLSAKNNGFKLTIRANENTNIIEEESCSYIRF